MIYKQLVDRFVGYAKDYIKISAESIKRNNHMNNLESDLVIPKDVINAVVVDFINFIATEHCIDLGLYTKDLEE